MESVGWAEIGRILAVTDAIGGHREHVVVPLGTRPGGPVRFNAPESGFDEWLTSLPLTVHALDHPS